MFLVLLAGLALMYESRQEPLAAWDNAFADFLSMHSPRAEEPDAKTAEVAAAPAAEAKKAEGKKEEPKKDAAKK